MLWYIKVEWLLNKLSRGKCAKFNNWGGKAQIYIAFRVNKQGPKSKY
jgi:hypothetical protein